MSFDEAEVRSTLLALVARRDADGIARFGDRIAHNGHGQPRFIVAIGQALADCGAVTRSLAWYERIELSDKSYIFSRLQMARLLISAGKYKRVLRLTDAFSGAEIAEPLALARVKALIGLGRYHQAATYVEQLELVQSPSAALLEAAADAMLESEGWNGALAYFDRALLVSREPRLEFRRAVALFKLNRLDECLDALHEARASKEFFLRAQYYIIRVHQRRRDADEVEAACLAMLSEDPANEFAHETLIKHHINRQDFAGARTAFEEAHSFHPDKFPKALINFLILERQGRLRDALKEFRSEEAWEHLSDDLKDRIGSAFYFSGQYPRSRGIAKLIADEERRALFNAKLDLAIGRSPKLDGPTKGRDGGIARALALYQQGRFDDCIETLDGVEIGAEGALALRNLRNLALSGRVLPAELYAAAAGVPHSSGPLPIIQLLWVGSALSNIELLSIRSFLACGHEVHLYSYDQTIAVPVGCVVMDAGEILPEAEIFAHSERTGRSKGSLAGFADLFRWKLIYERGGAWADCDIICLRPIDSATIVSTEFARLGAFVIPAITNCFFASPPGEPAFLRAFEEAGTSDRAALLWGEIGIQKMSDVVAREHWHDRLTSPSDLCPIPSFRIIDAIHGKFDVDAVIEKTACRAVHLYNEVMRMVNFDKNAPFPRRGLLRVLEDRVARLENNGK